MSTEKSAEYIGYGIIANFHYKIFKLASKIAGKYSRKANKLRFEQYKLLFGERDDDIYISTYPKSGTTLMQMILYQLTSDGNLDFNHIYDVSPWIRNASYKNQKPVKLPSPRLIKTHDYYKDFEKGIKGKFIFVYRNGMDVSVSMYHQDKNYNNPNLDFNKYVNKTLKNKKWFKYTSAWLKNKHKHKILYVNYEDLINNKEEQIHRIIDFCELKCDKQTIERALKYSSFEFMKEHEEKFGDKPVETKKIYDQFIRKGKPGEGESMFNDEQKKLYSKHYNKLVQPLENKIFNTHQ